MKIPGKILENFPRSRQAEADNQLLDLQLSGGAPSCRTWYDQHMLPKITAYCGTLLACGLLTGLITFGAGCGTRLQRTPVDLPATAVAGRINVADWGLGDGLWLRTDPGCRAASIALLWSVQDTNGRVVGAGVHAIASDAQARLRVGSDGMLAIGAIVSDLDVEVTLGDAATATDVSVAVPGTWRGWATTALPVDQAGMVARDDRELSVDLTWRCLPVQHT